MEEVFKLAKALGRTAAADDETLLTLCALAWEELLGRLREGVAAEDCTPALRMGSAWLALSMLCAGDCTGGTESFSAGALTIKRGSGKSALERAVALRRQAEQVMAPYLKDREFRFLGVGS